MNPYEGLPTKAFWKLAVSNNSMFDISELWDPKFKILQNENVVTYGSCFAQHIGNALQTRKFKWISTEAPPFGLSKKSQKTFNYNVFSARTGNIYTTTLLRQWTEWALGHKDIPDEVWEKGDRYYDPFRPKIEPDGFKSPEEARSSLRQTISSFKESIETSNYFVFTLGLTERWINSEKGYEYPMCPGTVAGDFNPEIHKFDNLYFLDVLQGLTDSIDLMKAVNPKLKFILTVSPVPLTATKSGDHVAIATMASKSVLRAVTHQLVNTRDDVDYFPSYEVINSPVFKGAFFEPNQRSVNPYGVNFVMDHFFQCLEAKYGKYEARKSLEKENDSTADFDQVCEEELLEAFTKK